jgi:hypothetical protein
MMDIGDFWEVPGQTDHTVTFFYDGLIDVEANELTVIAA